MKKLLTLVVLALVMPLLTVAQDLNGTWKLHPTYMLTQATNLIDTEHHVYALTNGSLVSLDKGTWQVSALTQTTGLSDVSIKSIYYNYDKQYLLIVYNNSNLDFLYEDGSVVNVSDLHDVVMNVSCAVNDATFADGKVLLATGFGLVIIDDSTMHVTEFRNYDQALTSATMMGDHLLIAYNEFVFASNGSHELLSDFSRVCEAPADAKIYPIDDNNFFVYGTGTMSHCELTDSGYVTTSIVAATPNYVQRCPAGWLACFRSSSYYYTISSTDFTATKTSTNTTTLYSQHPTDGTMWLIDGNGIHQSGVSTYYKPDGMYLRSAVTLIHALSNPLDQSIYVTTGDQNGLITSNFSHYKHIFKFDGNAWTEVTPSTLRNNAKMGRMALIPGKSNSYFFADRSKLYRVIDGELKTFVANTASGALVVGNGEMWEPGLAFDSNQNLWYVNPYHAANKAICMLPREKVLADTIKASDWYSLDLTPFSISYAQRQSIAGSTTGEMAYVSGYDTNLLNVWRIKPGATDSTDVEVLASDSFTDQDGRTLDWYMRAIRCLTADSVGNIWVGTNKGVFYFKSSDAFNSDFHVTVPVTTNGEAPYGSDAECTAISVDPQNRKWLGTREAGLYVVSADGTEVLAHYDIDNSALPSSFVYGIATNESTAVIVTSNGVAEFSMSEIAQAVDYTAVTAAPAFVEPGYTGFVTIGQVEPGACVRITDRDGNLVREFTATGAQVAWDTCLDNGERVPTGVYNVYAGASAEQLPASPQARIKIIK